MKNLKALVCLFLFQFILMISPRILMAEGVVFQKPETEKKEKNRIEQAEIWNRKGIKFYKENEYGSAIECFQKAIKLNPADVS